MNSALSLDGFYEYYLSARTGLTKSLRQLPFFQQIGKLSALVDVPGLHDALATLLWPESDGREGRARLRRTLHRLNEAIGDHILDSAPEAIR